MLHNPARWLSLWNFPQQLQNGTKLHLVPCLFSHYIKIKFNSTCILLINVSHVHFFLFFLRCSTVHFTMLQLQHSKQCLKLPAPSTTSMTDCTSDHRFFHHITISLMNIAPKNTTTHTCKNDKSIKTDQENLPCQNHYPASLLTSMTVVTKSPRRQGPIQLPLLPPLNLCLFLQY